MFIPSAPIISETVRTAAIPFLLPALAALFFLFPRKRAGKRGLRLLLLISLALLPAAAVAVQAEDSVCSDGVCLGTGMISNPTLGDINSYWLGSFVYYGKYDDIPMKYRVLTNSTTRYGGKTMLLDCDSVLYTARFDEDNNEWANSELKTVLNGDSFLNDRDVFTDAEKAAIVESRVDSHPLVTGDGDTEVARNTFMLFGSYVALTGEKIFLLDAEEVSTNSYGYITTDIVSTKRIKGLRGWWLRSARSSNSEAGAVFNFGSIESTAVNDISEEHVGVSPAFNVDLSSVIFSSEISESDKTYKLSLLDEDLVIALPSGESDSIKGSTVTVPYSISGEHAANATRVLVVVTDGTFNSNDAGWSDGALIKQIEVKENPGTAGKVSFDLDSVLDISQWESAYHVYLIAEIVSEGSETNYASAPVKLSAPVHEHNWTYAASGAEITAYECDTLGHTGGNAVLRLSAPAGELTYDGTAKEASYSINPEGSDFFGAPEIEYKQGETVLTSAPVNAGDYTSSVTLTGVKTAAGEGQSVTAAVDYTITPKSVTVTAAAEDKVYDGTLKAVLKGTPVLQGIVEGDDVSVSAGEAVFEDAAAGENKTVTFSEFSLSGADRDNYELSGQPADAEASITKRPVTVTAAAEDKEYDGTVQAVLKGTPVLQGIVEGDDVSVSAGEAVFEDAAAGENKTVTFSEFSLSGADRDNYELSGQPADAEASITKRPATVTAKPQSIKKGETIRTGSEWAELEGAVEGNVLSEVTLRTYGTQIIPSDAKIAQGSAQPKGDYTAPYDIDVTDNYDITYVPGTLTVISGTVSYQVTFKVVNGAWNDGSRSDMSVTLSGNEGDILTLSPDQVPEAGSAPDEGFKAGGWDREPDTQTPLTGNVTYIYTYDPDETPGPEPEPERPGIDFFRLHGDCELPATGFSTLRPALLPEQPKDLRYEPLRMDLMLPTLDREIELVTMPREGNSWAAAWLGADAGILEGSALPGEGVSIIAAHNTLNNTDYGPFALLSTLEVNDTVMVLDESGALMLFRVYANELLEPDDMERLSALAGDDALVLLTCENESPSGTYLNRRAVFAKENKK